MLTYADVCTSLLCIGLRCSKEEEGSVSGGLLGAGWGGGVAAAARLGTRVLPDTKVC